MTTDTGPHRRSMSNDELERQVAAAATSRISQTAGQKPGLSRQSSGLASRELAERAQELERRVHAARSG